MHPVLTRSGTDATRRPPCASTTDGGLEDSPTSRGFASLLTAYRDSGGTARGEDVARVREEHGLGDFVDLARLIATDGVFGFQWRGTLWIPMFQFDFGDLRARPAVRLVLRALGADVDNWARAMWFVRPDEGLQQLRPVDLMDKDLPAVLRLARAARAR